MKVYNISTVIFFLWLDSVKKKGFAIDLAKELSRLLRCNFTIKVMLENVSNCCLIGMNM